MLEVKQHFTHGKEDVMAKQVLVPIADGNEEIEAVCIIDVLRRAGADVTVAAVGDLTITASRGVKIVADTTLAECSTRSYDLIVLPGGKRGAEHLRDSEQLAAMLNRQRNEDRLYAAICASPALVFQHHGLLQGRRATCHPDFVDRIENRELIDSRVVVDGRLVTSRGPGTAIEFALKLVELLYGSEKAAAVAGPMLVR
jgi:4-methyl-5(b-hydroxyethyl)-thiazole monophosphate biosynthesis